MVRALGEMICKVKVAEAWVPIESVTTTVKLHGPAARLVGVPASTPPVESSMPNSGGMSPSSVYGGTPPCATSCWM